MTETTIHFKDIHSASCTPDGQNVVISLSAPSGVRSILLRTEAVPNACIALLEACANAKKLSADPNILPMKVTQISALENSESPQDAYLAIHLENRAAPLTFLMPRQELAGFAWDILQSLGIVTEARSKPLQ